MFNPIKEYKELKYLAYHDQLTGLLNRNWLYKNIKKLRPKYVYFIDINGLGDVNKLGHDVGDSYIKSVVDDINVDGSDILIRYGGDEFILLACRYRTISSNESFAVGGSHCTEGIELSIKEANIEMLKNKPKKNMFKDQ